MPSTSQLSSRIACMCVKKMWLIACHCMYNVTYAINEKMWGNTDYGVHQEACHPNQSALYDMCEKMAWGDDDGGDKKKGCFKCGEKIREIYVPKEEIDDSKLLESCAVICVNGM